MSLGTLGGIAVPRIFLMPEPICVPSRCYSDTPGLLKHAFQAGSTLASFATLVGEQPSNAEHTLIYLSR
jgi:hypothetical protein